MSRGWLGARQQRWAAWKGLGAAEGGQERPEGSGKRPEALAEPGSELYRTIIEQLVIN